MSSLSRNNDPSFLTFLQSSVSLFPRSTCVCSVFKVLLFKLSFNNMSLNILLRVQFLCSFFVIKSASSAYCNSFGGFW